MLEQLATWLSIGAVVVSVGWFFARRHGEKRDIRRLEDHLNSEKHNPRFDGDTGKRTTNHLMRELGLSEDHVLRLSTKSTHVQRSSRKRDDGMSGEVLFEYVK